MPASFQTIYKKKGGTDVGAGILLPGLHMHFIPGQVGHSHRLGRARFSALPLWVKRYICKAKIPADSNVTPVSPTK
jgi:hypothetical protein